MEYADNARDCETAKAFYEKDLSNPCIKGFNPLTGEIGPEEQQRKEVLETRKFMMDEVCK